MNIIKKLFRHSITNKLFCYFSAVLIVILTLSTIIESIIIGALLTLPSHLQHEFKALANEAQTYISHNDLIGLKTWEEQQDYTIYVVDETHSSITMRDVHPHVQSKMAFSRSVDKPMGNKIRKPIIAIDLSSDYHLMIQLPWQLHPADRAKHVLWAMRLLVAICLLAFVSWLLSKHLQRPLKRLQQSSRQLASGDLSVRVATQIDSNIREFNNLANDFDHMADRVETLVLSHKQLLRNISHELRTPLTRQGLAMHLLKSRLQPNQECYFQQIEQDVIEMNNLIQQILEFSRLESSHYQVQLVPTKLGPLLQRVIDEMSLQATSSQHINLLDNNPKTLALVDLGLISSVLQNALSNGLKYAGEQCEITVTIAQTTSHILLTISDDGPGIIEQDLDRIFEPFYRVDNSRDKEIEGYGLGMSIMKQSIEQMNGTITASSPPGFGLTLNCAFPLQ
ncbi:MAG: histidine kinase sensor domain-containing protein [Gammaproteobacteria bacterium]|nr:histidine kinase sensor domain-containing protein [Gammaproteobacteria bacterium]